MILFFYSLMLTKSLALNGGAQAVFHLNADLTGKFDTGLVALYDSDYSGLSIPGIISVGPRFSINAQAVGKLDVTTDATVTACYTLPNLQMVYPQDQGASNANADQNTQSNRESFLPKYFSRIRY